MNMDVLFFAFKFFGTGQHSCGHIVRGEISTLKRCIHAVCFPLSIRYDVVGS